MQPWPAAGWSEKFRFEKGNKAVGYVHNALGADNKEKWIDETKSLNGALYSIGMSLAGIASLIGFSLF